MDTPTDDPNSLKVVVFYPDGLAQTRVMSVLQRIHYKLWPAFEFQIGWGKFEHLEDPMVRRYFEDELTKADILCVATRNQAELPNTLQTWLRSMQYSHEDRPLVALLDISPIVGEVSKRGGAALFLESFAQSHRMDFLPYYTSDLAARSTLAPVDNPAVRVTKPVISPQHWLHPPQASSLNE